MIHPDTAIRPVDPRIGFGCVATRVIPAGTIVWALDPLDRVLSHQQWSALPDVVRLAVEHFAFRDADGNFVVLWDHARFVNHSFHPNTCITPFGFDIALRDIAVGEELRGDYGCLHITEPFTPFAEPGADRAVVTGDDLPRIAPRLDAQIAVAVAQIPAVAQPLRPLVDAVTWAMVEAVIAGTQPLPSLAEGWRASHPNSLPGALPSALPS